MLLISLVLGFVGFVVAAFAGSVSLDALATWEQQSFGTKRRLLIAAVAGSFALVCGMVAMLSVAHVACAGSGDLAVAASVLFFGVSTGGDLAKRVKVRYASR